MGMEKNAINARNVPPAAIAALIVALVALIVWWGFHTLTPQREVLKINAPDTPVQSWIRQKAHESGGDINKLNAEDKQRLQKETRGMGERFLREYASDK